MKQETTGHQQAVNSNPVCKSFARKGFTLVELLIVIAIIAILAGMLLPALKGARDTAKSILCVNNQKQIFHVANNYSESYNTWLPPAYADNTKAGSFKSYFTAGTFSNTASPNTFVTFMDIIQYFDKGIQEDKWNLRDGPSSSPYNQIFFCPSDLNPNHYVGKGHVESISYGANMAAWAVNS